MGSIFAQIKEVAPTLAALVALLTISVKIWEYVRWRGALERDASRLKILQGLSELTGTSELDKMLNYAQRVGLEIGMKNQQPVQLSGVDSDVSKTAIQIDPDPGAFSRSAKWFSLGSLYMAAWWALLLGAFLGFGGSTDWIDTVPVLFVLTFPMVATSGWVGKRLSGAPQFLEDWRGGVALAWLAFLLVPPVVGAMAFSIGQ